MSKDDRKDMTPIGTREDMIPGRLAPIMSDTSDAHACFSHLRFSGKLQAFLIGYNNGIYSDRNPYI